MCYKCIARPDLIQLPLTKEANSFLALVKNVVSTRYKLSLANFTMCGHTVALCHLNKRFSQMANCFQTAMNRDW